jgi:hypothetical protein
MTRYLVALAICGGLVLQTTAQDTKWQPPPTPDGFKAVVSKDGIYRFFIPQQVGRSGSRDHSMNVRGTRMRAQINYYTLKSGQTLEVEVMTLSGAGTRGLTADNVLEGIVEGMKGEGYNVSEPKATQVGSIKAREYHMSNNKASERVVMFVVKPRVFILTASAANPALVEGEPANTFLKSLVMVPPDVLKAANKAKAEKNEAVGEANLEKYGAKWTMAMKDLTAPEAPAVGLIRGKEFKADSATLQNGNLELIQGAGVFPEGKVSVVFLIKGNGPVENQTIEIAPNVARPEGKPVVWIATMDKGARSPKSESFLDKYAMKVTLGSKDAKGNIPGTIYLCTPDGNRSFVAGTFTAKTK